MDLKKIRNGIAAVVIFWTVVGLVILGTHFPEITQWVLLALLLLFVSGLFYLAGYHMNESDY